MLVSAGAKAILFGLADAVEPVASFVVRGGSSPAGPHELDKHSSQRPPRTFFPPDAGDGLGRAREMIKGCMMESGGASRCRPWPGDDRRGLLLDPWPGDFEVDNALAPKTVQT